MGLCKFSRRTLGALAIAVLLLAGAGQAAGAETKTLEGVIGDAMCGVKHQMGNMPAKECTLACVKMGSAYALIVGDTVYELSGKSAELEKLAGVKAKVTGNVDGQKIQVTSVEAVR